MTTLYSTKLCSGSRLRGKTGKRQRRCGSVVGPASFNRERRVRLLFLIFLSRFLPGWVLRTVFSWVIFLASSYRAYTASMAKSSIRPRRSGCARKRYSLRCKRLLHNPGIHLLRCACSRARPCCARFCMASVPVASASSAITPNCGLRQGSNRASMPNPSMAVQRTTFDGS
jgi:hypothetical protein